MSEKDTTQGDSLAMPLCIPWQPFLSCHKYHLVSNKFGMPMMLLLVGN